MNQPRIILALAAWCVIAVTASAQDSGLDFLQIGPDARSMALGDAQVAQSRDAYATYWNPAGLAAAERNSAAVSHHLWVADVRTYALATRLGFGARGALGFAVTATGTSDLEARDGPGDPSGLFGAQFISISGSYGRSVGPVRVGFTAKYLSEEIFDVSANGYALDFGAQADLLNGAVEVGAAFVNVGKMSELGIRATRLPRMLRGGLAIHPLRVLSGDDDASVLDALVLAEVSHVVPDERTRLHLGIGAEVMELVMVRVGYVGNDELRTFTFGLGLEYEPFQVDYAFLPFEAGFDGPGHVMSLSYRW
jgi:hypothetical protein